MKWLYVILGIGIWLCPVSMNKYAVLPIILAGILGSSLGIWKSFSKKDEDSFVLLWAILYPILFTGVGMSFSAADKYEFYEFNNAFTIILLTGLALSAFIFFTSIKLDFNRIERALYTVLIGLSSLAFSAGSILLTNVTYDVELADEIEAQIVAKDYRTTKRGSKYNIYVNDGQNEQVTIEVRKDTHDGLSKGDSVQINLKTGFFGFKWIGYLGPKTPKP